MKNTPTLPMEIVCKIIGIGGIDLRRKMKIKPGRLKKEIISHSITNYKKIEQNRNILSNNVRTNLFIKIPGNKKLCINIVLGTNMGTIQYIMYKNGIRIKCTMKYGRCWNLNKEW